MTSGVRSGAMPGCTSHVTRHTSHVTRHTSHVTRHTSHVTRHTLRYGLRTFNRHPHRIRHSPSRGVQCVAHAKCIARSVFARCCGLTPPKPRWLPEV
ncbi:hypothetical protein Y024_5809 [Burkholderia pseudomallei TSV44]|nr:hypothetical protein Y024_5809 [Burkholderia pseudomallei TSV44]